MSSHTTTLRTSMKTSLAVVLASTAVMAANPLGPGSGPWVEETPTAHGLTTQRLDNAWDYLVETGGNRGCLLVVKDGALVYERYNAELGYTKNRATYAWSATKTLGAMLTGAAVKAGVLDLDAPIEATYGVKSPKEYDVTARQIMAQTLDGAEAGQKWAYDFDGSRWINKLAEVVSATMGVSADDVWARNFEAPLGLSQNFSWVTPPPSQNMATGSAGTCRDFARLGQLLLNEGKWAGIDDILPPSYVRQMTTPQSRNSAADAYANTCAGLLTWTSYSPSPEEFPGTCYVPTGESVAASNSSYPEAVPKDINFIIGALGQITMQFPSQKMVVVSMGFTAPVGEQWPHHIASRVAEAATCEALPGDLCGDWDKKTYADVSGGPRAAEELITGTRELLNTMAPELSAQVPDVLLQQGVYAITTNPELIVTTSSCLQNCATGDQLCRSSCIAPLGMIAAQNSPLSGLIPQLPTFGNLITPQLPPPSVLIPQLPTFGNLITPQLPNFIGRRDLVDFLDDDTKDSKVDSAENTAVATAVSMMAVGASALMAFL